MAITLHEFVHATCWYNRFVEVKMFDIGVTCKIYTKF
jgi:hypothetical protein